MENKLFIKSKQISIRWDDSKSEYARARTLTLEFDFHLTQNSIEVIVDERVNEIYPATNKQYPQLKFILKKYEDLKSTDFRYRIQDGYEGIPLKLEDFINYLKTEDRDLQLNKILI